MALPNDHKLTFLSTTGGALTALINALQAQDLVRTCVLASVGTMVSFLVTLVLKKVFERRKG
jgi:hypothetical protein